MFEISILAVIIFIFAVMFIASGVIVVRQAETVVIERLGKYHATLSSGLHVIIPILDRPRSTTWKYITGDTSGRQLVQRRVVNRIDLRETVYDFPRQNVITSDNVVIEINVVIFYQVIDPMKVVYEIANLPDAIEKLSQTTLRNIFGDISLDQTFVSRDTINNKLRVILDEATEKWGVKVNRVELQDIIPPADIKQAMEKQMRAERDRRAIILEAEGMKQSAILQSEGVKMAAINQADGQKQAAILSAEGQAQARVVVAEAEAAAIVRVAEAVKGDPTNYLVALKYIEALKTMVEGKDNKVVYMPYEATGVLSSLGGIKELLTQKS
ncbi:MAG: SPFH domain-containing protein [Bacillota bacterium]